jgi:adenylate kinase family enzyme
MRASIIGSCGAGKSTFGKKLAERLGCRFVELDSIYHQANWQPLPEDQFRARVSEIIAGDAWVCDGNYSAVHALVLARATDVIWLDPPKPTVMLQVIKRSLLRAIDQTELWNGNRERISEWLDPEHPIRWAWSTFERRRRENELRLTSPDYAHVRFHRLRDRRAMARFLSEEVRNRGAGTSLSPGSSTTGRDLRRM